MNSKILVKKINEIRKTLFIDENSYLISFKNSINVKLILKIILGIIIFQCIEVLLIALSKLIMLI
jgi:hypothetical protein